MRRATVGKLLGLAGVAGVAATGAVLARDERQRRAHTPDDVRARLHERHAQAEQAAEVPESSPTPDPRAEDAGGRVTRWVQGQRRRLVQPVTTAVSTQVSRLRRRRR